MKIYSHTISLCPECKEKVQAKIIEIDNEIFIEKFCSSHGFSRDIISSDKQWFENSRTYIKPGQIPLKINSDKFKGCPDSCGFCPEHQQHTCLPVIEINYACDLSCPVCLKGESQSYEMPPAEFENMIDNVILTEGQVDVINISGGEPLLHSQIEVLSEIALKKGITQISISTNGLELIKNEKLRKFLKEKNIIIALQFDGFEHSTYEKLRGINLSEQKLELIKIFEQEGINYSLVATVAKNINDTEIKSIVDYFFQSKALTLMFQPITFTGNAKNLDVKNNRITTFDVIKEIEKSGFVTKGDFNPLPCSHYSCFSLAYYIKVDDENYYSLKNFLGEENYLHVIANKTLPGLDKNGFSALKAQLYEFWSAADSGNLNERVLDRIRNILKEMQCCGFSPKNALNIGMKNMKAVFIHHFMDAYNFDFARLIKCCNPYPRSGNKLVPICAANI